MPVYEYECSHCGAIFELLRSVNSKPPRKCPECGESGGVSKRVTAPAFQFKGSGWYVTDYAGKGKAASKDKDSGESKPAAESSSGGDAKPADDAKAKPAKEPKSEKPKAKDAGKD